MPVSLSRVVGFRAVHRFYRPDWSEDRNRDTFGPLSDAPGHEVVAGIERQELRLPAG